MFVRKNIISWYKQVFLQSHLLGVSELFIGHHSDNILHRTEPLRVTDIPSKIAAEIAKLYQNPKIWNPQIVLDQGYAALTAIIQTCSEQSVQCLDVDRVWRVEMANRVTKIQELTAQEAKNLAITNESMKRIGIVPSRVIEVLRVTSKEQSNK